MISLKGTDVEWKTITFELGHVDAVNVEFELYFVQAGLEIQSCSIMKG